MAVFEWMENDIQWVWQMLEDLENVSHVCLENQAIKENPRQWLVVEKNKELPEEEDMVMVHRLAQKYHNMHT